MKMLLFFFACIPIVTFEIVTTVINYQDYYFYYHESGKYLVNYLTNKPVLEKLFDFRANDAEFYRPRELGNVFNMLDAYAILLSFRIGIPHFLSIIHILAMVVIAIAPCVYSLKTYGENKHILLISVLLGLLFLSSTGPFFSSYYFRTSKQMVAVLMTVLFFVLWHSYGSAYRRLKLKALTVCLLTTCMGIVDETGIVMGVLFCCFTGFAFLFGPRKRVFQILMASMGIGLGFVAIYRRFISPLIVHSVLGFWPVAWGDIGIPRDPIGVTVSGLGLLMEYSGSLIRAVPPILLLPLIVVVAIVLAKSFLEYIARKRTNNWFWFFVITITFLVCGVGGISLILGLMGIAFPSLYLENTKLIYYPIPFVSLWYLCLISAVFYLMSKVPQLQYVGVVVFFGVVCLNIFALPSYHTKLQHYPKIQQFYGAAKPLLTAINDSAFTIKQSNTIDGGEVIQLFKF